MTIDTAIEGAKAALMEIGIKSNLIRHFRPIYQHFNQAGEKRYSQSEMDRYVGLIENRFANGEIGRDYYSHLITTARRIMQYVETGNIVWATQARPDAYPLNSDFNELLYTYYKYLRSEFPKLAESPMEWIRWVVRRYMSYLLSNGVTSISELSFQILSLYLDKCRSELKSSVLSCTHNELRRFHAWLSNARKINFPYKSLFLYPVIEEKPVLPAFTHDDVTAAVNAVDRNTPKGKRDYAIIQLGMTTGLRACDISALKLSDINWKKGEFTLCQQKTDYTVTLPLLFETGAAIKEYILNARPKTSSGFVFCRMKPPYQQMGHSSISHMFAIYLKKSGVKRDGDAKHLGFHTLRRTLGRDLSVDGISIILIAQILGHRALDSSTQYIPLDSKHLKQCSLDFGVVPVLSGAMR